MPSEAAPRIRVAVVDSGVHAAHPHVGGVAGGIAIGEDGGISDDFVDRLGHGTAVAAAIREKAPDAELFAVKVFWRTLATDVPTLVRGIDEACGHGARVVNLSLGTTDARHRDALAQAVERARRRGAFVVAAAPDGQAEWLPGALDDVVAVELDWSCNRHEYRVATAAGRSRIVASGYPRDIPGVPRDKNLRGISFAVANASGFVARALRAVPVSDMSGLFEILRGS